ncbi:MAG: SusF/SusE family outer membrane protein [Saprospiraceae bacterium]|nr:SusF/SusE family outer membrane protein [Saprospiraceae bacterium]
MKSRLLFLMSFVMMTFVINAQVTSVGLIGSATTNGWDADTPMTKVTDSTWTLEVTLKNGDAKFRADGAWAINWGDSKFPVGVGTQDGPNIPVFAGDYTVNFNSASGAYSFAVKSDIGIIGSATPGGWDNDTNMYILDSVNYFTIVVLKQGDAKFRKDDAWAVNWGSNTFPDGIGTQDGPNIPVAAAGRYRVDFNKASGEYKFKEVVDFTSIAVIGSATAGGWDNETPLTKDAGNPDLWKGVVAMTAGEFKFRANNAWSISWGGGEFPSDTASLNGSNIVVPAGAEGDYQVSFDTKSLIYKFLKIGNYQTIGIIGDATPGGWDNETKMIQDATDKSIWRLRTDLVAGEAKFRANNAWEINWGSGDFPTGTGVQDGANIPVVAGDYKITFNSTTGEYNFEAVVEYDKISIVGNAGPFGEWPGDDDSRDTYLNKDPNDANHWTLASVTLKDTPVNGGIKFRAEAAWAINWGAIDFPSGVGTQDGHNIECAAGTYKVDFKSDTGEYAFAEPSSTYDLLSSDVIKIFPNPAKDVLNVEINTDALKGLVNVTIFNIKGEQIKNQTMSVNGNAKINISDLQAGNYVLRVANDKNIVSKSIIVIK